MKKIVAVLKWSKADDIQNLFTEKYRAYGDRMGIYALLRRNKNRFVASYVGASSLVLNRIREHNDMNIIEINKGNDSYRPRTICTGYTVTSGDRRSRASVKVS